MDAQAPLGDTQEEDAIRSDPVVLSSTVPEPNVSLKDPTTRKLLLFSTISVVLCGFGLYAITQVFSPPEVVSTPSVCGSDEWLTNNSKEGRENQREYDKQQRDLFLSPPPDCSTPGLMNELRNSAALDYIAKATFEVNQKGNICFGKDVLSCLQMKYVDIARKATKPGISQQEKLMLGTRLWALTLAVDAVNGQAQIDANFNNSQRLALLAKKLGRDIEYLVPIEQAAKNLLEEEEADQEAQQDAKTGFEIKEAEEQPKDPSKGKGNKDTKNKAGRK